MAETDLVDQLDQILDKPDGVEAVHDGALTSQGSNHAWTDQELFSLADDTFNLSVDSDTIKMHVLFVDGHSARDDESSGVILGIAWGNTHLVMFKQTIEDICTGPLTPPLIREKLCESAEFSIWVHEAGHVLGLVNTGLPMVNDHEDTMTLRTRTSADITPRRRSEDRSRRGTLPKRPEPQSRSVSEPT